MELSAPNLLERICWIVLALVHLTPALAFLKPSMLTQLYAVERGNPLFVAMHHRSALFVVVLTMCIWPMFDPRVRTLSVVGVGASVLTFLFLYWRAGAPALLRRIAIADTIALPAWAYVAWRAFSAQP